MNFEQIAQRFQFTREIPAALAIRIVQAYIDNNERMDPEFTVNDTTQYVVRLPNDGEECDGCGDQRLKFVVDQRAHNGGSFLGSCCWFQHDEE